MVRFRTRVCKGKTAGAFCGGAGDGIVPDDDGAGVKHFLDQLFGVFGGDAAGGEIGDEAVVRDLAFGLGEAIDQRCGGFIQLEDGAGGDQVEESAAAAFEGVEFAEAIGAGGSSGGGHWATSGWSQRMYVGTVTTR